MMNPITFFDENLLSLILSYLTAKDLCQMSMTCKAVASTSHHPSIEAVWKALTFKRFGLNDRTRKSVGVNHQTSMKELYTVLHYRKQIPDGKFTSKQNFVFGKGHKDGVLAWLVVAPSANAMLKTASFQGQPCHKMELRFCIQNIRHSLVKLNLSHDFINVSCITSDEIKDGKLRSSDFKVLSKNGLLIQSSSPTTITANESDKAGIRVNEKEATLLHLMEYAVISCQIYCPETIENEADLLTMLTSIHFHFKPDEISSSTIAENMELAVIRSTDEDILNQYVTLPSGLVMLRDKSINDWK